jgi:hypothetical protein
VETMAKKIVNKSVSFNILDPFQFQMKKHTEQFSNFSSYIKSLIQRDMENGTKKATTKPVINQVNKGSMSTINGYIAD